jgi:transcription initiation factor TFIIB
MLSRDISSDICPECNSILIIDDSDFGEKICSSCGLVLVEKILAEDPEWRAFTLDEQYSKSRVGPPLKLTIHDKGLSTVIGNYRKDIFGKSLSTNTITKMNRLNKLQVRSSYNSSIDRNLNHALTELDRFCDLLHIPITVKERAAFLYRRALDKRLVRGRSIPAIMAACLYTACREVAIPRTLNEFSEKTTLRRKEIARSYRLILIELNLQMPTPNAQDRVPKIAANADISEKIQHTAIDILRQAARCKSTAGKDPTGLAAAALYIASYLNNEKRTQQIIAKAAKVTEVTIRNRYKELTKTLNIESPKP